MMPSHGHNDTPHAGWASVVLFGGLLALSRGAAAQAPEAAEPGSAQAGPRSAPASAPPEPSRADEAEPALEYGAVATASRAPRPRRALAATVSVLAERELDVNPSLTADLLVRSLPSLATFRQSTSLSADPTSQGLNLRGVGPSGVSRALLLVDGVPANDPFGGWIYWRSLPMLGLSRVEVLHGGGSALYGSAALAGVVQMLSRSPRDAGIDLDAAYGSYRTGLVRGRAAHDFGAAAASVEGEGLMTSGYHVVPQESRGDVDQPAESYHGRLQSQVVVDPNQKLSLKGSLTLFDQDLHGGTRLTTSHVRLGLASLGLGAKLRGQRRLEGNVFGRLLEFEQGRPRFTDDRDEEVLVRRQRVPAGDAGGSLVFTSAPLFWAGTHLVSTGIDARYLKGRAYERSFPPDPTPDTLVRRSAGGEQLFVGAFAQELYTPHERVQVDAALRADLMRLYGGSLNLTPQAGETTKLAFATNQALELSPRLGVLVQARPWLALRASGYRSFRAPTLNESYRPFQVGTLVTAANPDLVPEHLSGLEAGVESQWAEVLTLRGTGFWNRLDDPITNVTLETPLPDGAQRQRRNLGAARVAGLELGLAYRWASFSSLLAYTLAASEVTSAPGLDAVVGKRLAHAPVHRASMLLSFDDPRLFTLSVVVRYAGTRFEDDLNTLPMKGFAVIDVSVRRHLFWDLWLFAAAENLLDQDYLVSRAGIDQLGQPLMARIGLSLRQARARAHADSRHPTLL